MSISTSDRIKQEALIVFNESGYEGASMREIAKRTNISAPAIYKHYSSKEDLFDEVINYCFDKFLNYIDINSKMEEVQCKQQKLYRNFKTTVDFFTTNMEIYGFYIRFSLFPPLNFKNKIQNKMEIIREPNKQICMEMHRALRRCNQLVEITEEELIASYESFIMGYMGYLAQNDYILAYNDYLDKMWKYYWIGILNS